MRLTSLMLACVAVAGCKASQDKPAAPDCHDLPSAADLANLLKEAPKQGEAGGMASGKYMWGAVVNAEGKVCAVATSTDDPSQPWPGSQSIALAKAFTANAFSTDQLPLSTARLYTLAQPGHSLFSAANANPFNPECNVSPKEHGQQVGKVCGGTIVFGGGFALYKNGKKIGGLGVSGDTSCADNEIGRRVRDKAGLNPPGGQLEDDIVYMAEKGASVFAHPLCTNTWHNGKLIGNEPPASGY